MRTGVENFVSEQLTLARQARGLTRISLAEISGVSAPTLSKWENKSQYPSFNKLEKVATALNFPVSWFLEGSIKNDSPCFFRSLKQATKCYQDISKSKLIIASSIVEKLEDWIEFPELNLPDISIPNFMSLTNQGIENIALQCRNHWKLGIAPIFNMIELLENSGVFVIRDFVESKDMDGVSTWINNKAFVFLSADKENYYRGRFDAAHELAHLILHREVPSKYYTKNNSTYQMIEHQANYFASCFLMPAESIGYQLEYPTLDKLLILKKRWGISVSALIMRAESLNIIDADQKKRLYKNLSSRGWRKGEPLDDETPVETSKTLSDSISLLIEEGECSKESILDIFHLSATDLVKLCNLPEYFFQEKSNVIKFKSKFK